jgi:hypothetical protein
MVVANQVGDLLLMLDTHSLATNSKVMGSLKDILRILHMIQISFHLSNSNSHNSTNNLHSNNRLRQEAQVGSGKAELAIKDDVRLSH